MNLDTHMVTNSNSNSVSGLVCALSKERKMALREAQEDVIKALDELKTAVAAAGDSTCYRE